MKRAFSLTEVLLTVAVIGLLLSMAVPSLKNKGLRAKEDALRTQLDLGRSALGRFAQDLGCTAKQLADLQAVPTVCLSSSGSDVTVETSLWKGPYLPAPLGNDPVSGSALVYTATDSGGKLASSASGNDSQGVAYANY